MITTQIADAAVEGRAAAESAQVDEAASEIAEPVPAGSA